MKNKNVKTNNNTPNMSNLKFTPATINPNNAKLHQLLIEMGYDHRPDQLFANSLKYFGHYERPVIDLNDNLLTHSAEVLAAKANGLKTIEVYRVNMNALETRQFIALKHKYNKRDLIASYETIKYFENYLKNDAAGINTAKELGGTMREKIAQLMHTSDSTIKRIKEVGDNKPEKLGLIAKNEISFKEVLDEIKANRMRENAKKRTQEKTNVQLAPIGVPSPEEVLTGIEEEYDEEPASSGSDLALRTTNQTTSTPGYVFSNSKFTIDGMGDFEINVTGNRASLFINGEELSGVNYAHFDNTPNAHSFVISQKKKSGLNIQLTIENFSNAA